MARSGDTVVSMCCLDDRVGVFLECCIVPSEEWWLLWFRLVYTASVVVRMVKR
jgi:hypothetical protein